MRSAASQFHAKPPALQQTIKTLLRPNTAVAMYHLLDTWGVIALVLYGSIVLCPVTPTVTGHNYLSRGNSYQYALRGFTHEGIQRRL